ncbi:MAG: 1,4-dihydroxy-2-naphthoate polyprenyltransferase [Verrucomicrobia bacterium]|nr:1,4-dihydroxy-2-naphthoate polyprenyltransferase [Verrucomicrobiota bacterium]
MAGTPHSDAPIPRQSGASSTFRVWLQAARPKTLSAAFAPVLIGSAMALADGVWHMPAALAALLGAWLIQIGTNFANDYGDFIKGADAHDRQGPLRATQAGLIAPRAMLRAALVMFALAAVVSVYLVLRAGWPLVAIAALSIVSGVLYTVGPWPLAYKGLGDLFVLIFFGPVAVGGTYYVQALVCPWPVLLAGLAPGLLAAAILVVNNLRDIKGDARVGKRTLAVRFGVPLARVEYVVCVVGATVLVPVALLYGSDGRHARVLLASLTLCGMWRCLRTVCVAAPSAALNPVLAQTARSLLVFSILFAIGWNL